jgi:hypothetical protein
MGLILLVLIGFIPSYYALDLHHPRRTTDVRKAATAIRVILDQNSLAATSPAMRSALNVIIDALEAKASFNQVVPKDRREIREAILRVSRALDRPTVEHGLRKAIEP